MIHISGCLKIIGLAATAVALSLAVSAPCQTVPASASHATRVKKFPLWKFDENGCRAKGRLQDKEYCSSRMMDQIIAAGKDAIPVLISQIIESRPLKRPIYDYWSFNTTGDLAFFILNDLFLDSDWKTFNLPGVESPWEGCKDAAENCWTSFLKRRGRKFLQEQWQKAWEANKTRIYWDEKARCFRLFQSH